jgi:hypothetical protein
MGERVKITSDLSNGEGTFGAGHEFEIIDVHARDEGVLYDLRDHESRILMDVPFADLERE